MKAHKKGEDKLQSAMEYLLTYGWAILAIAVILAVMYFIGIFNPEFYAPRALPGSCTVLRPNGPGTTFDLQLAGQCTNDIPQFAFAAPGPGDVVYINNSSLPQSALNVQNSITISAWVYVTGSPYHDVVDKENQYGMKLDYDNEPHTCSPSNNPGWCLEWDTSNDWNGVSYPIPEGDYDTWMFLAVTATPTEKYWYGNGQLLGTESVPCCLSYAPSNVVIGSISEDTSGGYGSQEWYDGLISNVQIYSSALSQNAIEALYIEGVGGPPLDLQNLVAWWPLNGNGNDYSGNQDQGTTNSIFFNGNWWTTYSQP